ncbi:MAG: hypothetical protein SH857_16400 [Chitinophagales bacterium]|nr:hypothetical protein [Chitinophagales bacterium]
MKSQFRNWIWIAAIFVIGIVSFFSGKALYYKDGYRDGVIFADSSSFKRGKSEGFRDGYEYCDSITEDLDSLRKTEMFNLNIIFEEIADPKGNIEVSGELKYRDTDGTVASKKRFVKARIVNAAAFARYNELVVIARFKDKRDGIISEMNIELPDILYPRKSLNFEIPEKDVPELAESVDFILESAQGVD